MTRRKLALNILQAGLLILIATAPRLIKLIKNEQQLALDNNDLPIFLVFFIFGSLIYASQRFRILHFEEKPSIDELRLALKSIRFKVESLDNNKLIARPIRRFKWMGDFRIDRIEVDLQNGLVLGKYLILDELNSRLPPNKRCS